MRQLITMVRHGANHKEGDNLSRPLTHEGRRQAAERRKALGSPRYDLVLASPALRARETAEIIGDGAPVRVVDDLFPDPAFIEVCMAVLEKSTGEDPLSTYLAEEEETIRHGGATAWNAVRALADEHAAKVVLVVGHNPLIQSMGCAATRHHLPSAVKNLEQVKLGECEGYTLTLEDSETVGFQLHQG